MPGIQSFPRTIILMAYKCTTCSRVLDESAKTCPRCGRDFSAEKHVKVVCRRCTGKGYCYIAEPKYSEVESGWGVCPSCNGSGGIAVPVSKAGAICRDCDGRGFVERVSLFLFKRAARCRKCDGRGRLNMGS